MKLPGIEIAGKGSAALFLVVGAAFVLMTMLLNRTRGDLDEVTNEAVQLVDSLESRDRYILDLERKAGPEVVQVRGEGLAAYTDRARSRGAAIEAAQRDAVEKAVGVMIESESTMQNFNLVKDEVLSRSKGFIKTYKIVD